MIEREPEPTPAPAPQRTVLATPEEVANFLRITTEKLSKMRVDGTGPRFMKVGRDVRYAWPVVHRWCDAQHRDKTTEAESAADLVTLAIEADQTTAKPSRARRRTA